MCLGCLLAGTEEAPEGLVALVPGGLTPMVRWEVVGSRSRGAFVRKGAPAALGKARATDWTEECPTFTRR